MHGREDSKGLIFSEDQAEMVDFNLTSTNVKMNQSLAPFSQSVKNRSPKL